MRFIVLLFTSALLFCSSVVAVLADDSFCLDSASIDIGIGYRSDQLDWNIAGDAAGENPNILSELSWDNLEISQLQFAGTLELAGIPLIKKNVLVQADVAFGKIWSGTARDSDYAGDNRAAAQSRSVGRSDSGFTADISGAIGPIFEIGCLTKVKVLPLIGYAFDMQALTLTDGHQLIAGGTTTVTPIAGLDSSYTAYWYGPWMGVNLEHQPSENITLTAGVEYHWISFFAQADWNLRSEFEHPVSFEHEGSGSGVVWEMQGSYRLNEAWQLSMSLLAQDWQVKNGTDRTFLSSGSVGRTRLNRVNWESYAVLTGFQYQF